MISIGIPAYNEEDKIRDTINTILNAILKAKIESFEIIVINDGSKDNTKDILLNLQPKIPQLKVKNFEKNQGIGFAFKEIIKEAIGTKICFIPGDNIITDNTVNEYFKNIYKADIIFVFFVNKENRNSYRIFLSQIFNMICTFIFKIHVNYLNGSAIYDSKILKGLDIKSDRYFISAEMNLKMLFKGSTFYEIPGYIRPNSVKSNAISFKNLLDVIFCFLRVFWEVKISKKNEFNKPPVRIIDL